MSTKIVFHDSECNVVATLYKDDKDSMFDNKGHAVVNGEVLPISSRGNFAEDEAMRAKGTWCSYNDATSYYANKDHSIRYNKWCQQCGKYRGMYDDIEIHQYVEGSECHVNCASEYNESIRQRDIEERREEIEGKASGCIIL